MAESRNAANQIRLVQNRQDGQRRDDNFNRVAKFQINHAEAADTQAGQARGHLSLG